MGDLLSNRLPPADIRLKEGAISAVATETGGSCPLPRAGGALPARWQLWGQLSDMESIRRARQAERSAVGAKQPDGGGARCEHDRCPAILEHAIAPSERMNAVAGLNSGNCVPQTAVLVS